MRPPSPALVHSEGRGNPRALQASPPPVAALRRRRLPGVRRASRVTAWLTRPRRRGLAHPLLNGPLPSLEIRVAHRRVEIEGGLFNALEAFQVECPVVHDVRP